MAPPPPPPSTPSPDDAAAERDLLWMQQVQQGDMNAFRALVETHQHRVAALIARMVGDQFDHAELAHEVFVRVWKSAARYEPSARFTTWLMTIARNMVLNEFRSRSRRPTVPLEPSFPAEESLAPREFPDHSTQAPDSQLQEAELQEAIERALALLPEAQRTAIHLRRTESLSYEDIAVILQTSVASVKSLLFRARTELRASLREFLE